MSLIPSGSIVADIAHKVLIMCTRTCFSSFYPSFISLMFDFFVYSISNVFFRFTPFARNICCMCSLMMWLMIDMGWSYRNLFLEGCRCVGTMHVTRWIVASLRCGTWRASWGNKWINGIMGRKRVIPRVLICWWWLICVRFWPLMSLTYTILRTSIA